MRPQTVGDALARRVEARRGAASRLAEALRELGAVDQAVYEAVARTPTAELDGPVRRLSDAADRSRLWLGIAAVIALRLLAAGVAYSRVHTGVHYPGDVMVGSIMGAGTAAMVAAVYDRLPQPRRRAGGAAAP